MKSTCFTLGTLIILSSCSTSFQTQFLVPPKNGAVTLAKNIAIVNQTGKLAATNAIAGFLNSTYQIPSYNFVLTDKVVNLDNDSLLQHSTKLLCNQHQADAVLILEDFTTDVNITKTDLSQNTYSMMEQWDATMQVDYALQWKYYDPKSGKILDEFESANTKRFGAKGDSEYDAEANLPDYQHVLTNCSFKEGQAYATRVMPVWEKVSRSYFLSTKPHMLKAAKQAKKRNWIEAANKWKKEYELGEKKTQAKAAYNMALACEMEGNIDEAIRWAQVSYFEHGFSDAGDYILLLRKRDLDNYNISEHLSQIASTKAP